jgi:hypothetical protein
MFIRIEGIAALEEEIQRLREILDASAMMGLCMNEPFTDEK